MTAVYKYKVDWCDGCNQGWIEIKKNSINHKIRFRCSECLTEYETYEDINIKALGELDWSPLEPSDEDILRHDLWRLIIKECENYQLIRNDGVIIKAWSKEKKKFIKPLH
ncbi:hypothetical protein [Paenibacillus tyrfis]|uniref:hypothetical protein n=1 Tax=Paenibacillus tyrfis TaxID=1501230 RepID=UPI00209DA83B|nr:hypothetical protein [Paenibacillus tyrfis]MCP1309667.1 hypothetical protein [Paenibacillus tyrfis]